MDDPAEAYEKAVTFIVVKYGLTDQEMISIIARSLTRVLQEIAAEKLKEN